MIEGIALIFLRLRELLTISILSTTHQRGPLIINMASSYIGRIVKDDTSFHNLMLVVESHRKNHGFVTKTDLKQFYGVFCVVLSYIFSFITCVVFDKFIL